MRPRPHTPISADVWQTSSPRPLAVASTRVARWQWRNARPSLRSLKPSPAIGLPVIFDGRKGPCGTRAGDAAAVATLPVALRPVTVSAAVLRAITAMLLVTATGDLDTIGAGAVRHRFSPHTPVPPLCDFVILLPRHPRALLSRPTDAVDQGGVVGFPKQA